MSTALQYVATSALSLTLSGNTGVAPFLTLLLVGVVERSDPTLLQMEGWIEKLISSWPSIAIFSVLTILEFVGKCVPCVDAIIDSAMTFVVPILSVFGSLASFGLFTAGQQSATTNQADGMEGIPINVTDILLQDEGGRLLQESSTNEKSGWLIFLQVMLCLVGICLALLVHLFKMVIRLLGEGCCTCCITSVEYSWVAGSVLLTIFIVPIAIGTAIILMVAAAYGFKQRKKRKKRQNEGQEEGPNNDNDTNANETEHKENEAKDEEDGAATNSKKGSEKEEKVTNQDDVPIAVAVIPDEPSQNPDYIPNAEVEKV